MKNILLVEDDPRTAKAIQDKLLPLGIKIFWCQTYKSALADYLDNRKILDLILLDGYLSTGRFGPNPDDTTIPLVILIKKDKDNNLFKGITVAMSTSVDMREEMMKLGCDLKCHKSDVPGLVKELHRLPPELQHL